MTGADFLQLRPQDAPRRGITDWLTAALRSAIADGRLTTGARLPPTRALATDLAIARGAVVAAYDRLAEEGLIQARTRAGTVVLTKPVTPTLVPDRPAEPVTGDARFTYPHHTSQRIRFDLTPGLPDLRDFPRAAWLRHERAALAGTPAAELGYGDPRGLGVLRTELAGWLTRTRGLSVNPDEIIVVAGVAQSLALLGQVLAGSGRSRVAVEDPGSAGAAASLAHWGMTCVPVAVDDQGVRVDRLAALAVDAALVTPAHQFPTGVVLGAQRRLELLDWASTGGLVIEDDYDADQRYDRSPVAALQPMAPDRVAHTGSTSKSLAPGLRLGWLVPPPAMFDDLVAAKHASDLCGAALPQLVLAGMLRSGDYERHLRRARTRQRARRDALAAALAARLPNARVAGISAGLHLHVTFGAEAGFDDRELAIALWERGVRVQPLGVHRHRPGEPGLVLGYGVESPAALAAAVEVIAEVVGSMGRR